MSLGRWLMGRGAGCRLVLRLSVLEVVGDSRVLGDWGRRFRSLRGGGFCGIFVYCLVVISSSLSARARCFIFPYQKFSRTAQKHTSPLAAHLLSRINWTRPIRVTTIPRIMSRKPSRPWSIPTIILRLIPWIVSWSWSMATVPRIIPRIMRRPWLITTILRAKSRITRRQWPQCAFLRFTVLFLRVDVACHREYNGEEKRDEASHCVDSERVRGSV
ncbi:hypothetical protein EX30DRAFT_62349 [Ascodesmis nigricans]|uniref:Uncharacterized protein n=1 Tax=Ascodesmis nigricans TaxID=341454 RepID=A0A4S2MUI9_9PEZI|nr:hypothetical protein EX30DRAFT_62349 [Ascodesmis nigricans]